MVWDVVTLIPLNTCGYPFWLKASRNEPSYIALENVMLFDIAAFEWVLGRNFLDLTHRT